MKPVLKMHLKLLYLTACVCVLTTSHIEAHDYYVTGKVTDSQGNKVVNAKVSMVAGATEFAAVTNSDGSYNLRISGIYENISGTLQTGNPFPNPFSNSVNIPFIINSSGDVRLSVYNMSGQKVKEEVFSGVAAGSYRIIWDGCNQSGSPQRSGYYIYSITFKGVTRSGKLIKFTGFSTFSEAASLVPAMLPPVTPPSQGNIRVPVITGVTCQDYYPVRLTDISIGRDTVINFELGKKQAIPFKTSGNHIAMYTGTSYRPLILKGINLGSSPPGYFPGEIDYAISPSMYEKWINMMGLAGFNSIRVYTLHPPVFYEKLAEYNQRNPNNPLLLFQGIWLEEVEDPLNPASYDLINRIPAFTQEIHEEINCIHGNGDIAFRYGKAYGKYITDISRWTAGYIIGREISPQEVDSTDSFHKQLNSYSGFQFSISGGTATEVFAAHMLDEAVAFETKNYSVKRPVSISSWPTLDPLSHPTEIFTDEDRASFDISKISGKNLEAGLFACYHAYPYYPNFISQQPSYQAFSDSQGQDSYLGYLTDLKHHYNDIPLVIGEFGVPSSWGSAHQSYSNMNHGGYSGQQQGEKDLRMLHNIVDAGCAGGFIFSWMDEWFKPTWIVAYLEAYGFFSNNAIIPTRQLWHNITSPEQNFGMIAFDQDDVDPFIAYQTDMTSGPVSRIEATNDNGYFYVNIEASGNISKGDTLMLAFDTYLKDTGESLLPNKKHLNNRSEFLLSMVFGNDTAIQHVTEAYDMDGFTPRFNLTDPSVQKFQSTVTDGKPWNEMQWYNDGAELTKSYIGRLPMENATDFTEGQRSAVAWSGQTIKVRMPWTMLNFYDPTHMKVINGAVTNDGGRSYEVFSRTSDGIALSVYYKGQVVSTTTRYSWTPWLVVPNTSVKEKKSLQVVRSGLSSFPGFAD